METEDRGRYRDVTLLGRGGMASVYRAHDTQRGITIALKVLRIDPEMRHREERVAQFHREYRTLAELAHPRVIQVFDYGIDADGPFYTMELLDGEDLSARAPVPWREACSLTRDVCSSLALLHSRGYLHRDVSPLNVRCTGDGRAKLIDFGAMAPMGVNSLVMGTPPCVAPEVLSSQPLDGRTDLFALGATLYYTLTRRQAYSARDFTQLRAAHERRPLPPSAYASDVPPALDRLVLSLLSLDPMARPRHAAEVMDRLTTLAELGPIEPIGVQKAYLNTPELVGRKSVGELIDVQLGRARAGRGLVLRLYAPPGGGRSRMLQAVVMDARLSNMVTLSVSASSVASGPYGVLRALLTELGASSQRATARLREVPALQAVLNEQAPLDVSARESLLEALSKLFNELARLQPILIAVDDIHRCDEPSLAALLTLAAVVRKAPLALVYTENESEASQALALLRELARSIPLSPLSEPHTEALLASVFGAVPNLQIMSRFVYERALGNPRSTLELAQAIVDRGLARYELGSWSLPSQLAPETLPQSLSEVRRNKLAQLSPDALELAQLLALTNDFPLPLEDLRRLTEHGDLDRVAAASADLIEARMIASRDAQVLADRSWLEIVRQNLDRERCCELQLRLAKVRQLRGDSPIAIARCLIGAEDEAGALDVLCSALKSGSLVEGSDSDYPDLLQQLSALAERLDRSPLERFLLARELVELSDRVIVKDKGECFRTALRFLHHDGGLADWDSLPDTPDRLTLALTALQARYDSTPPERRGLAPLDAIRSLVETVYATAVYAAVIGDMALIDSLPSLAPLEPLSPAIASISEAIASQRDLIAARYEDALAVYLKRLAMLDDNVTQLTEAQLARSRLLLNYVLGALLAGLGIKGSLGYAQTLESLPGGQVMAAAVRESYYVRLGNTRAAHEWRRRMELLQIQLRRPHALKLRQTTQQVECSAHADDLEETKRNVEVLEELCVDYPAALPYLHYGRAEYERIRGNHAAGLRLVQVALAEISAGQHPVWPWAAGCEIECLRQLGRREEALEVGQQRVGEARAAGLKVMADHIDVFVAFAEADLGRPLDGLGRVERGIEYRERLGMSGLNMGWSYEARARIALVMRDRELFERSLRGCAAQWGGGRDNPALAARYERLLQEARATWDALDIQIAAPESAQGSSLNSSSLMLTERTHTILAGCRDRDERANRVLQQLLDVAHCPSGQLYLLRESGLVLAAGPAAPDRRGDAQKLIDAQSDQEDDTTADDEATVIGKASPSGPPETVHSLVLTCLRGRTLATVGVLTLDRPLPEAATFYGAARLLSNALIDLGDVRPVLR